MELQHIRTKQSKAAKAALKASPDLPMGENKKTLLKKKDDVELSNGNINPLRFYDIGKPFPKRYRLIKKVVTNESSEMQSLKAELQKANSGGIMPSELRQVELYGTEAGILGRIARTFGTRIVYFEGTSAKSSEALGYSYSIAATPKTVFINIDASEPLLQIFGHELTHDIQINHPALFEGYLDALKKTANSYPEFYHYYQEGLRREGLPMIMEKSKTLFRAMPSVNMALGKL